MNINNIKDIINEFLQLWKAQEGYVGMLLTGSFASNTGNEDSDIDLRIVYDATNQFHEFGDVIIAGKSISFVGMSATLFQETFQDDLKSTSLFEIRRFAIGQIIDDKSKIVAQLQEEAVALLNTSKIEGFDDGTLLFEQLMISRKFRVLLEMPETDLCFKMAYYDMLKSLFEFYAQYLQADIPVFIKKWSRFLTDITYRKVHLYTIFPDSDFVNLIIKCFQNEDLDNIKTLYHHVIQVTGEIPETNFFSRFHQNSGKIEFYELE